MGKIGYIRRFIPALGELISPMRELLKETRKFTWTTTHQVAFEKIKSVVTSTPVMSPPIAGKPLRVYLAVTSRAINGLIAQEEKGEEKPVAYFSRTVKDVETRYSLQERQCLGLVYAAKKYIHYFQGHTIHVMSKSEGIRYMLNNAFITGRVSRWALLLGEYDIQIIHPQRLNCQALADMMALCEEGREEVVLKETTEQVQMSHVPRIENKHADALVTIGSKEESKVEKAIVMFRRMESSTLNTPGQRNMPIDWRDSILSQLRQKVASKSVHDYHDLRGILHRRSAEGLLMKCITKEEGNEKMKNLHQAICGQNGPSLYRRM
ncbi:hypothetical protein SESBI_12402 [Sesbania bispinosa]|nr:hypothetical protein SESBI_12402 [Sesbania bispinosa]